MATIEDIHRGSGDGSTNNHPSVSSTVSIALFPLVHLIVCNLLILFYVLFI